MASTIMIENQKTSVLLTHPTELWRTFASGASFDDDRNFSADDSAIGEMGRTRRKGACGGELLSIETYMFIITERRDYHPVMIIPSYNEKIVRCKQTNSDEDN